MEKALGLFYGQAVGDALGQPFEFRKRETVLRLIQKDENGLKEFNF